MNHTTAAMKAVFEEVKAPYSGLDPKVLEEAIYAVNIDNKNASLKEVISETAELIAKNSIMVQHPDCIAHLHTPPLMPSVVAEAIIASLNQSMDSWDDLLQQPLLSRKWWIGCVKSMNWARKRTVFSPAVARKATRWA